jgi:release factor glutamine methyltransferase
MEKTWTVIEMIQWGKQFFEEKNIDSPRLTMELLLAHVTGLSRVQLYTSFDKPLSGEELDALRPLVRRRAKFEPLQYILGTTDFYGLNLVVTPDVLIPRPETEVLVESVIAALRAKCSGETGYTDAGLRVLLDIGTGSGCIALALAKQYPALRVVGIDVSARAVATAQCNAERLGVHNVEFRTIDILTHEGVATLQKEYGRFDVLVSNPPYIAADEMPELQAEVGQYEPSIALTDGHDGLTFYRRFAAIFPALLQSNGLFAVEIGYAQESQVVKAFEEQGFSVSVVQDFAGIPRVVVRA